ncbi:MAG: DUF4347 domain-containing protein, partial [Deltaproteobacteria bacterium]|nr:DUF4347 domain-containing protein [Deltaproteobacteria bacterium]
MARTPPHRPGSSALVEELEGRVLLSADLQPVPLDPAESDVEPDLAAHVELVASDELTPSSEVELRREIVFVDAGVENRDILIDDLRRASPEGRSLVVFELDDESDGIAQIADFLADHEDLDAVHVISHGTQGALQLGNTWLDADSLETHSNRVAEWGDALGSKADLLFYGCDLAGGEVGAGFVETLGKLTGADVAASVDATGADVLGGDWDLEHRVGDIETAAALAGGDGSWRGVLANQPPVNSIPDTQSTPVDTPLLLSDASGNGLSISDPDAGSAEIELTLQVTNGTLTISGPSEPVDVNTETSMAQTTSQVARDLAGNTIVVWASDSQDSDGFGIYGQRYDTSGNPVGSEFQINTTETGDQSDPVIAMDANGDFVVVWQSADQDGDSWGIYGQRYDASGTALGSEFLINTATSNEQTSPDIAMDDAGNFVVVWQSLDQDGQDWGVFAQRFDQSGVAQGGEFQVNSTTGQEQSSPAVAMDADGDFAMTSQGKPGNFDIYLQQYDSDGTPVGGETQVNTFAGGDQTAPDIAMDGDGDHFVVWEGKTGGTVTNEVQGSHVSYAKNITYLTGDGVDDSLLVIRGTLDDLNAALDGMVFTPTLGFVGTATIEMTSDDLGNTGGGNLTDNDTLSIQVGIPPVNDAPVLDASADLRLSDVAEDATDPPGDTVADLLASAGTDPISDADGDPEGLAIVGVDDTHGSWQYSTDAGGTWQGFGAVSDANAVLLDASARIRFVPAPGYDGPAGDLTFRAWDETLGASGDTGVVIAATGGDTAFSDALETATLDVLPVNDAPVHTLPGSQTTEEDTDLVFSVVDGNPIRVMDTDSVELEVSLSASGGTLSLAGTNGLVFENGDGTADQAVTLRGTEEAINAALDGLTFRPTADFNGTASLQIETSDLGGTGSGPAGIADDTIPIEVTPVNDAPTQIVPGVQQADASSSVVFSAATGNSITISDIDSNTLQVTLRAANGTVTLGSISGLSFGAGDGRADEVVTFSGSQAAVNGALEGLRFQAGAGFAGTAAVEITTDDFGLGGLGGPQSANDVISIGVKFVEIEEETEEAEEEPEETSEPEAPSDPNSEESDPSPIQDPIDPVIDPRVETPRRMSYEVPIPGTTADPQESEPLLSTPPAEIPAEDRPERIAGGASERPMLPRDLALSTERLTESLDEMRQDMMDASKTEEARNETLFASVRAMALAASSGALAAMLRG